MPRLILLRHGESEWNHENRFAGWSDIDLTERGVAQAVRAGGLLREHGLRPDAVHTSVLRRTIETAALVLLEVGREQIPSGRTWRLNDRHYGALQGQNRQVVRQRYGDERFAEIRRSFTATPPPFEGAQPEATDVRYAELAGRVPRSESLRDLTARLMPYWHAVIASDLRSYETVLVVGHGNSLRALIKHLDGLSDDAVVSVTVPTAVPLLYVLDDRTLAPTRPAIYLDQDAADAGIAEVVAQGEGVRTP
jgi:2,3-bisphosphoglycerate-dependent phosphoglycerate mutase